MSDVVVAFRHWRGDHATSREDSGVISVHHFEIDGHYVWPEFVQMDVDGFVAVSISVPEDYPEEFVERHKIGIEALRDEYTTDDWLEGTTDEVLILPVARLQWTEMPVEVLA